MHTIVINASSASFQKLFEVQELTDEEGVFYPDFYMQLLLALGYNKNNIPLLALVSHLAQTHADWLVTPVHIHTSHNDALITNMANSLKASPEALQQAYLLLKTFLKEEYDATLTQATSHHWLLSGLTNYNNQLPNIASMYHASLIQKMRSLDDNHQWSKLMTECQMLLATEPGILPTNGIWVTAPVVQQAPNAKKIWTDDSHLEKWLIAQGFNVVEDHAHVYLLVHPTEQHIRNIQKKLKHQSIHWQLLDKVFVQKKITIWGRIHAYFSSRSANRL